MYSPKPHSAGLGCCSRSVAPKFSKVCLCTMMRFIFFLYYMASRFEICCLFVFSVLLHWFLVFLFYESFTVMGLSFRKECCRFLEGLRSMHLYPPQNPLPYDHRLPCFTYILMPRSAVCLEASGLPKDYCLAIG